MHLDIFFFYCLGHHRALHSFPTRRSSDLLSTWLWRPSATAHWRRFATSTSRSALCSRSIAIATASADCSCCRRPTTRSEEHTSELQSLRHLVCRLLLEKKKNKTDNEKKHI